MSETAPTTVEAGLVITMGYSLMVDGNLVDTSEGPDHEPIQFIQGEGHILPALEEALYGMTVGESKSIILPAEKGYGEIDPDDVTEVPRSEFPSEIPLQPGVELEIKDQDGEVFPATITKVTDELVQLDFNHPLAGKELHFAVQIIAVRQATPEELEHGHVHLGGEHTD